MEATLKVLNDLEREGVITRYASDGGVGAIFYMEPFLTYVWTFLSGCHRRRVGC